MRSVALPSLTTMGFLALGLLLGNSSQAQEAAKKSQADEFTLATPTAEQLFRAQSEDTVRRKIRESALKQGVKKVEFPSDSRPTPVALDADKAPAQTLLVPVGRVCFKTLYFEDLRTERALESSGRLEPLRSACLFYANGLTLPVRMFKVPPHQLHCWTYPFVE